MQAQIRTWTIHEEVTPDSDLLRSRASRIRSIQKEQGGEACFLTDERLFCSNYGCEWRKECCRLIAVWKR